MGKSDCFSAFAQEPSSHHVVAVLLPTNSQNCLLVEVRPPSVVVGQIGEIGRHMDLEDIGVTVAAADPQARRPAGDDRDEAMDDARRAAERLVSQMTLDEKMGFVISYFPLVSRRAKEYEMIPSSGFTPGLPRLGIPALTITDASLGVANTLNARVGDTATARLRRWRRGRLSMSGLLTPGRHDRQRSARQGLQRHARWRDQPDPRPLVRPQFRICRRGSATERPPRRGGGRGRPVQSYCRDGQAFRAERAGNRPHDTRCPHRRHRPSRKRSPRPSR